VAERHSSGSFAKISNFEILAAYCCLLAQGKVSDHRVIIVELQIFVHTEQAL